MTPAYIADLGNIWWVEVPGAVILGREWLRENFGPFASHGGYERQEPPMLPEGPIAVGNYFTMADLLWREHDPDALTAFAAYFTTAPALKEPRHA